MGCHFLLQGIFPIQESNPSFLYCRQSLCWLAMRESLKWKWKSLSRVWLFATPYSPWNSPGQNIGVGSLSLLQGIFPTQGSNPGLLHCRWTLYQFSWKEWWRERESEEGQKQRENKWTSCSRMKPKGEEAEAMTLSALMTESCLCLGFQ